MPAEWTANIIGKMHLHGITAKELAAEAGINAKYLSTVLNGHKEPKNAKEKLFCALDRLIEKLEAENTNHHKEEE